MTEYYSPLLESTIADGSINRKVFVEAIIDENSEYTGRYRVTIDESIVTELHWSENDTWQETRKGETSISRICGKLIADNAE